MTLSNVLIGIIGVILFIGLALAGALYLGQRFTESKNTTTASIVVQTVSQISQGISYRNVNTATRAPSGIDSATLVSEGYLKSPPPNPAGDAPVSLSASATATGEAALIVARLVDAGPGVCGAIVRQTQNGDATVGVDGYVTATDVATIPRGPAGCFRVGAIAIGSLQPNQFYGFGRI